MARLILLIVGIASITASALFAWAEKGGEAGVEFTFPWPKEVTMRLTGPVAIFASLGVIMLILGVTMESRPVEPAGQIISPVSGEFVGHDIEARGVVENVPADQHLWLVVRDENLLYPQSSEIAPTDGEWSLLFHQSGKARVISLELYRVNDEGNAFIANRLAEEDFSGLDRIPGAVRLDVAENLHVRNPKQNSGELSPDAVSANATLVHPPNRTGLPTTQSIPSTATETRLGTVSATASGASCATTSGGRGSSGSCR